MDSFDPALDAILERAHATLPVMETLAAPPYNFVFDGPSSGTYLSMITGVEAQVITLAESEAGTTEAAAAWDTDLDALLADARLGTRLGRGKWDTNEVKMSLFKRLRYTSAGRDRRLKQAIAFEAAWKKADSAWVFKTGLTLAVFTTRRTAITNTRIINHANAEADEAGERVMLHTLAEDLDKLSVKWYDLATATFPRDTPAGQLLSTIPTTYDPNRPPGQLRFTAHMSTAPNHAQLIWRAPRGTRFYIFAKGPGQSDYELILDGVEEKEWLGLGVTPGAWLFKGYATNQHGTGLESEVVEINVMAAVAA